MVSVDVSDDAVLVQFQGQMGPISNKFTVEETEELIRDLERAIEEIEEE